MLLTLKKIILLLSLVGTGFPAATAAEPYQDSVADRIVGSSTRTAGQGYSQTETLGHLANFDHPRWDVKNDETKRFTHHCVLLYGFLIIPPESTSTGLTQRCENFWDASTHIALIT